MADRNPHNQPHRGDTVTSAPAPTLRPNSAPRRASLDIVVIADPLERLGRTFDTTLALTLPPDTVTIESAGARHTNWPSVTGAPTEPVVSID